MTATVNQASGANTSFGELQHIEAGLRDVGYADVAPLLAAAGYRLIVPYLRGYGTTRFLSADTFRNGEQAAVASDAIALMDALKIPKAIVAGFGRT